MKLIGRDDLPYVRRVGVTFHVLGLPFEHVPLSPFSQAAELRRIAPIGRMPALVLDSGETLIESVDDAGLPRRARSGDARALIPPEGCRAPAIFLKDTQRAATAACDKAIAINYERRRPAALVYADWISRCRTQLDAALRDLDNIRIELRNVQPLRQIEITITCAFAYIERVEPDAVAGRQYPWLEQLSLACEAREEFKACPQ